MALPRWHIQKLDKTHDRSQLDCGRPMLDGWLRRQAGQYERKGLARTYVAVRPGQRLVLGYYALSGHTVVFEALPGEQAKGLPSVDVPVVLLGRLAVDRRVQRQGLGQGLLVDTLRRAEQVSRQVGVRAVEVLALDEEARGFYLKFGFVPLADDPRHLYLPMAVVRATDLSAG